MAPSAGASNSTTQPAASGPGNNPQAKAAVTGAHTAPTAGTTGAVSAPAAGAGHAASGQPIEVPGSDPGFPEQPIGANEPTGRAFADWSNRGFSNVAGEPPES